MKILICEDELKLRKILKNRFSEIGWIVFESGDGQEGLEVALKERPDVILLDLLMPKIDGMEMLKRLREDSWGKQACVMILTNVPVNEKKLLEINIYQPSYHFTKNNISIDDIITKAKELFEKTL